MCPHEYSTLSFAPVSLQNWWNRFILKVKLFSTDKTFIISITSTSSFIVFFERQHRCAWLPLSSKSSLAACVPFRKLVLTRSQHQLDVAQNMNRTTHCYRSQKRWVVTKIVKQQKPDRSALALDVIYVILYSREPDSIICIVFLCSVLERSVFLNGKQLQFRLWSGWMRHKTKQSSMTSSQQIHQQVASKARDILCRCLNC